MRCANCSHSWFQKGEDAPGGDAAPAPAAAAPKSASSEQAPPPPPARPARAKTGAPRPAPKPERSSYAHEPPFRARRNPAKMMTAAAIAFAVLIAGIGGAVYYFGLPDWAGSYSLAFAEEEPDLVIELDEPQDRRTLPDGTEYFAASGTVINPTASVQDVPPLLVVLRDAGGRVVYSWTMKPPVAELPPGAKARFNEAKLDVPRAARQLQVGWAESSG